MCIYIYISHHPNIWFPETLSPEIIAHSLSFTISIVYTSYRFLGDSPHTGHLKSVIVATDASSIAHVLPRGIAAPSFVVKPTHMFLIYIYIYKKRYPSPYLSTSLCIYLPIHRSICVSIYLCIYLPIYLSLYLSILSFYLFI